MHIISSNVRSYNLSQKRIQSEFKHYCTSMNMKLKSVIILAVMILNVQWSRAQLINTNSSLITRKEFRELVDLISEEKQLRHTLEHNVDTLRQQIAGSEAEYQTLQDKYQNLSKAYNDEKAINADLVRQFTTFSNTNRSIQTTLSINHADILDLKQKTGEYFL